MLLRFYVARKEKSQIAPTCCFVSQTESLTILLSRGVILRMTGIPSCLLMINASQRLIHFVDYGPLSVTLWISRDGLGHKIMCN